MSTEAAATLARLLRERDLGPLLDAARVGYTRMGGPRGSVAVTCTAGMLAALADLMGWKRMPEGSRTRQVRVRLAELDRRLSDSRYAATLLDVLTADGGPVETRQQEALRRQAVWAAQIDLIAGAAPPLPAVQAWVASLAVADPGSAVADPDSAGTGTAITASARRYRRAYGDDPTAAAAAALLVARALAALPAGGQLLAVFAAAVTGDPHGFDPDRLAGRLLLSALAEQGYPADPGLPEAEARILQLGTVGLDVDSVSSTVLVANLTGAADPVLAAMSRHGGGWPVPLHALRNLRLQSADGRPAYVVENPPVFEHLERATRTLESSRRPALVCTGGFLSAAGVRLLDALQAAEFRLWYGGDFDRNGLTIAASLMNRYPGLRLWHMGPADYLTALDPGLATRIPNPDLEWLAQQTGALAATAAAMAAAGVPAYQERLVAILAGELSGAG